jgi:hypothetical protein
MCYMNDHLQTDWKTQPNIDTLPPLTGVDASLCSMHTAFIKSQQAFYRLTSHYVENLSQIIIVILQAMKTTKSSRLTFSQLDPSYKIF